MSSGPARRVSPKDIQVVQNLIERCLQLYMNQREVVETLLAQAKIEPGFTELVWQKLEEENREFFKAYYLRLTVKHQIMEFNKLLEQQVRLMRQMNSTGVPSMSNSNGSHIASMHQNSVGYAPPDHAESALKAENLHHPFGTTITNAFSNGGSSMHANMHTAVEMSAHAHPSMGLMAGLNGGLIKSEAGFSGNSPYMFGADGNVMEAHPSIADASFSSVESSTQALNEPLLDAETSFGFLGQIPRNFSLSDLTADYSQNDILVNYPKSPFLTSDNDFLDSRERELQGDNKRLDTISEGASYDNFGSD